MYAGIVFFHTLREESGVLDDTPYKRHSEKRTAEFFAPHSGGEAFRDVLAQRLP